MALIDRYLKPLAEKRADELHIYAGVNPTYLREQKPIRELDQVLTNDEILKLLQEVLTEDELSELQESGRLQYQYASPFGQFRCQIRMSDGELKSRFTFQPDLMAPTPSAPALSGAFGPTFGGIPSPFGPPPSTPPATSSSSPPQLLPPGTLAAAAAAAPPKPPSGPAPVVSPPPAPTTGSSGGFPSDDARLLRSTGERALFEIMQSAPTLSQTQTREIDRLFRLLMKEKGSDLHLSSGEKPMIRVDGNLRRIENLPALGPEQVAQLLAPIMPARNRHEFLSVWDTDFAYEVDDKARFRSNIFMDRKGIGAVFRLIPSDIVTAEQLGLPKAITDLCFLSKGLVLVTGPTGSGKSTTLCALIDLINRTRNDHIITIEDPIEFVHPNKRCLINQREIGIHTRSFKSSLRAALREDPDIILVGEMRDLETIAIAIETAETGHLVFGTLHTTSAVSTVDRMIDQFPAERQAQIRMMLSNSLKGVISQTLMRKQAGGRIAAMEVLLVTHGVANMIRERKIHQLQSIMQTSRAMGMQCLNDVLFDYVRRGIVDVKEAYIKAIDKINFVEMLEEAGINTSALTFQAGAGGDRFLMD